MIAAAVSTSALRDEMSGSHALSVTSPSGVRIGLEKWGQGPPLVLLHGAFSDHRTNWAQMKPFLEPHFSAYAMARRGRGDTAATTGHALEDEVEDAVALIRRIGAPVFLLGHSYGAHMALAAAARLPDLVRKLVLYEAPWPHLCDATTLAPLEALARADDWDGFATKFFGDVLAMPKTDLDALRTSEDWASIVADGPASLQDMLAVSRYRFELERYRTLSMPVLLQIGSESLADFYVTSALSATLTTATVEALPGQAHDAMITAPAQYAEAVRRFLSA